MKFILNLDAKSVHAENPLAECNIPTARSEGSKGTVTVSLSTMAFAIWARGYHVCLHCIGKQESEDEIRNGVLGEDAGS